MLLQTIYHTYSQTLKAASMYCNMIIFMLFSVVCGSQHLVQTVDPYPMVTVHQHNARDVATATVLFGSAKNYIQFAVRYSREL